ncbi:MAG: cytochrome c [Gammaproteobacteria bacterium]|nr:cytochrome c [Gammaproteobacteria bacterium]
MKLQKFLLGVGLLAAAGFAQAAEEHEAETQGGMTFDQKLATCAACHGPEGDKPLLPEYPKLAGQYASYLEHALKSYREGRRENLIMSQQVKTLNLSDSDIKRLAAHFSAKGALTQITAQ